MSQQYQIGGEIPYNGQQWRVVRIVNDDTALFENEEGYVIIRESYVMIKNAEGNIEFIVLSTECLPVLPEHVQSSIKSLETLPWRKP